MKRPYATLLNREKYLTTIKGNNSGVRFTVISVLAILFFAVLATLFPYTGDDWAWGSHIGIDRLLTFFDNYSGRYFANFIILAISRSKVLKVALMALCYYASCWLCYKYTPIKRNASLLLALVLFFAMPRNIFTQSVVWASGFSNYVPSALISVAYIIMIRNITGNEAPNYGKYLWICTFLMGFCGAPFAENVAVFNVCLGIAVIAYIAVRFKKWYSAHVAFLVGAIGGAAWMFSNSVYLSISKGADEYRQVATGVGGIIKRCCINGIEICDNVIASNPWLCLIASALLLLLTMHFTKNTSRRKSKMYAKGAMIVNAICTLTILCKNILFPNSQHLLIMLFMVLATVLYAASVVAIVLICVAKGRRFRMLLPFYCIPVSVAPLLLVSPIGPRCFYVSYLLSMIFVVDLFGYIAEKLNIKVINNQYTLGALCALALIFGGGYISIFTPIYRCDAKRNEFAQLQSNRGERKIVVSSLPNEQYLWTSSPTKEPWITRYKLFYEIREDAELVVLPVEEFERYYDNYCSELQ